MCNSGLEEELLAPLRDFEERCRRKDNLMRAEFELIRQCVEENRKLFNAACRPQGRAALPSIPGKLADALDSLALDFFSQPERMRIAISYAYQSSRNGA
jgi:hypothetical protein